MIKYEKINQKDWISKYFHFLQASKNLNDISKLETYLTKVNTLCHIICNDNVNIDQALIMYQEKAEYDKNTIETSNILFSP